MEQTNIATDGLFVNADADLDSKKFRDKCSQYGVIANTALNPRNGTNDKIIIFF